MDGGDIRSHAGGLLVVALAITSAGCALFGLNCPRDERPREIITLTGRVEPGQIVSRMVPYDQRGTQNDIKITWSPARRDGGPNLHVYATGLECLEFRPDTPACGEIGGRGSTLAADGELVQGSLIVAGGPRQRSPDLHAYMLHIAGGHLPADYSITIVLPRIATACSALRH